MYNIEFRTLHTIHNARNVTHKGSSFLSELIVSLLFLFSIERDANSSIPQW